MKREGFEEKLPEELNVRVIRAWKHLTRRLGEEGILNEQRIKKGKVWKFLTLIPDKIKAYQITKNTRKLYHLDNEEYTLLKAITNAYGVYNTEDYNSDKPLAEIRKSKLENMINEIAVFA